MKNLLVTNSNSKKTREAIRKVSTFIRKMQTPISDFLNENNKYKNFHISLTKFNNNDLELSISVYEDGQPHCYLKSITVDELQRCLKELGSKVVISTK